MRAVVLSHRGVADELGQIGTWLEGRGAAVTRIHREDSPAIPPADLLVVLGSPDSVATGHCRAAAVAEIESVREWVSADRAFIGVCFGAQVLARALGGTVSRMPDTFRHFTEFALVDEAPHELEGRWAVWHEDAIAAPPGSEVLARLPYADAVFRAGRAWGLQPHIEFDATIVENLGTIVGLPDAEWRPLYEDLRAAEHDHARRVHRLLDRIADDIL